MSDIKKVDLNNIDFVPVEGEVVQTLDGTCAIYKDNEWQEIKVNQEGSLGITMYELNKQIISQIPRLTAKKVKESKQLISQYGLSTNNQFYLLYGKEISYFTLFQIKEFDDFGKEVIGCLKDIGIIKAIDLTEDKTAIEIWITQNDTEESVCLYLFPYDAGIVKVGE
jgi:hypothetical protein